MSYLLWLLQQSESTPLFVYVPAMGYTPLGAFVEDVKFTLTLNEQHAVYVATKG